MVKSQSDRGSKLSRFFSEMYLDETRYKAQYLGFESLARVFSGYTRNKSISKVFVFHFFIMYKTLTFLPGIFLSVIFCFLSGTLWIIEH